MHRAKFYDYLRTDNVPFMGKRLKKSQVEGLDADIDEAIKRGVPTRHFAYILATDGWETGLKFQPVVENLNYSVSALLKKFGRHRISESDAKKYGRSGSRKANQEAIANIIYGGDWGAEYLGNVYEGDGWKFRGRGKPQLTGRANSRKFGIENDPDKALDLGYSTKIMFDGMLKGMFTGKKLSDFRSFTNMRQTVNGMDKARHIAEYANAFLGALEYAGYGKSSVPPAKKPTQAPKPRARPTTPNKANKPTGGVLTAIIKAILALVSGFTRKKG